MKTSGLFLFFVLLTVSIGVSANVTLPKIFSDNMVLQRETAIPVWGWATAGEKVEVTFKGKTTTAIADGSGNWSLKLKAEKAGGPFEFVVKGANTITLRNVLVGEVWLCSGQSNMEWTVGQSLNADAELAAANNPNIRQIKIDKVINGMPQKDVSAGTWQVSSPASTKDFTGVGYFFAKNIYNQLKVPIGLINSSWGGTNIETWISREGFESSPEFKEMIGRLPRIDLENLSKKKTVETLKRVEALQGVPIASFDSKRFQDPSIDESKLPTMNVPEQWEAQSLGEIDGVVWLRRTFDVSASQAGEAATLDLSKVDDDDVTSINGVEVGRTSQWDARRKYAVPAGVLKEGKNLIVVRVTDGTGGGGIYGDPKDVKLTIGETTIPLNGTWRFQVEKLTSGTTVNEFPSLAYNAMIHPLIPFPFRGVLWYQGETNAGRSYQYRKAFPLLIDDWRRKWNSPKFPFYYVQLATFTTAGDSNTGCGWAELREAQSMTLGIPNTGMCVTTDIGNPKDIHPINKQDVGKRLAALALNRTYNKRMVDSGPTFKSMTINNDQITITFDNLGSGLMTTDRDGLVRGLEIAGADQMFWKATGVIKGNKLIVSSLEVPAPLTVRFGWVGDASANNLFNKEGFPADPFRTDDWKTVTKDVKYQFVEIKP